MKTSLRKEKKRKSNEILTSQSTHIEDLFNSYICSKSLIFYNKRKQFFPKMYLVAVLELLITSHDLHQLLIDFAMSFLNCWFQGTKWALNLSFYHLFETISVTNRKVFQHQYAVKYVLQVKYEVQQNRNHSIQTWSLKSH